VFLIQRSQNKDSRAIHLKLNEIVAALEGASNRLINVEDLTEQDVRTLRQHYRRLVEIAKREDSLTRSHSIAEAEVRHRVKKQREEQLVASSAPTGTRLPASNPSGRGGARL
jgi:low affinity Fe/Cu permease